MTDFKDFKNLKCLNYVNDITFLIKPHTIYLSLDDINETQRGDEEKVVDGTLCICFVPMKSDIEEAFFDAMEEMPGESMCTG